MIYLKHIASGRHGKFSEGTIKALKGIPKGWVEVEPPKMNIEKLPPRKIEPIPQTLAEAEAEFEKSIKALEEDVLDEVFPDRDKMIEELKAEGVKVHPNIGDEKLKARYEDFVKKDG